VRWENERARLESKLRATRDDGSVKAQALEATINALRSRSGLHAEVARLGDEATALRRAESRLRHELSFAEERLGAALLELKRLKGGYGHDDDQPDDALAIGAAASAAAAAEGALERAQDRVVTLEKDAVRDRAEIRRLREELERVELERGRESSARADASVELAAALERCAARDRALHDARESAALEKERAAANRAHEVTAATRRSAAAEVRSVCANVLFFTRPKLGFNTRSRGSLSTDR
jgi:chromosome segregation ATPase